MQNMLVEIFQLLHNCM